METPDLQGVKAHWHETPDEINHHNQPAAMKIWQTKQTKASPFAPSQQKVMLIKE